MSWIGSICVRPLNLRPMRILVASQHNISSLFGHPHITLLQHEVTGPSNFGGLDSKRLQHQPRRGYGTKYEITYIE